MKYSITITLVILSTIGFHWQIGRSNIDEALILYIYPIIIAFLSVWIAIKTRSKIIWLIPAGFLIYKQSFMCVVYAIQAGSIEYLYLYGAPDILLNETIINVVSTYAAFAILMFIFHITTRSSGRSASRPAA